MEKKTCAWCEESFNEDGTIGYRTCYFCRHHVPAGLVDRKEDKKPLDFDLLRFYLNFLQDEIRKIVPDEKKDKCDCCDKLSVCANFPFVDGDGVSRWMDLCRICSGHLTSFFAEWVCSTKKGYTYRLIDINRHYMLSIQKLEKYLKALLAEKNKQTKNLFFVFENEKDLQSFQGDMKAKGISEDYYQENNKKNEIWYTVAKCDIQKAIDIALEYNFKCYGQCSSEFKVLKPKDSSLFEIIKNPCLWSCNCGRNCSGPFEKFDRSSIGAVGAPNSTDTCNGRACNDTGPKKETGASGPLRESLELEVKELRQKNLELEAANQLAKDEFATQYLELAEQDKRIEDLRKINEELLEETEEKEAELHEQDNEIDILRTNTKDQEELIKIHETTIKNKEDYIKRLEEEIKEAKKKSAESITLYSLSYKGNDNCFILDKVQKTLPSWCYNNRIDALAALNSFSEDSQRCLKLVPIEISIVD